MREAMTWARHSPAAICSPAGYIIERDYRPSEPTDTVFLCWAPDRRLIGAVSGKGIDKELAVDLCESHRARSGQ